MEKENKKMRYEQFIEELQAKEKEQYNNLRKQKDELEDQIADKVEITGVSIKEVINYYFDKNVKIFDVIVANTDLSKLEDEYEIEVIKEEVLSPYLSDYTYVKRFALTPKENAKIQSVAYITLVSQLRRVKIKGIGNNAFNLSLGLLFSTYNDIAVYVDIFDNGKIERNASDFSSDFEITFDKKGFPEKSIKIDPIDSKFIDEYIEKYKGQEIRFVLDTHFKSSELRSLTSGYYIDRLKSSEKGDDLINTFVRSMINKTVLEIIEEFSKSGKSTLEKTIEIFDNKVKLCVKVSKEKLKALAIAQTMRISKCYINGEVENVEFEVLSVDVTINFDDEDNNEIKEHYYEVTRSNTTAGKLYERIKKEEFEII